MLIEYKYSTFWPRVWAAIIDAIILCPTSILLLFMVSRITVVMTIILFLISYWADIIYNVLFLFFKGQTPGQMLFKLKVLDITENKLNLRQAIMKDSFQLVINILIIVFMFVDFPGCYYGMMNTTEKGVFSSGKSWWVSFIGMSTLVFYLADFITMLRNKKRRSVQDFIAGTVVVRTNIKPELPETQVVQQ